MFMYLAYPHSWHECISVADSDGWHPFGSLLVKWSVDVNASRFCPGAGLYFACDARLSHHFNRGCRGQSTAHSRLVLARVAVGHCAADSVWLSSKYQEKCCHVLSKDVEVFNISLSHLAFGFQYFILMYSLSFLSRLSALGKPLILNCSNTTRGVFQWRLSS